MRKPLQGVLNIVRFNWHFYVIAFVSVFCLVLLTKSVPASIQLWLYIFSILVLGSTIISLLTSLYVYDLSGLYKFSWIKPRGTETLIVNINAGFDETSMLLQDKFPKTKLVVLDFYDPKKHTEVSIKRAREAYPPFPGTEQIETRSIPMSDHSADSIFVLLAAHEIRNKEERILFFNELKRILKPSGEIYVTEHIRDLVNFMAYNIGFFHFHSKKTWSETFNEAGLNIKQELKQTPFISTFVLGKYGNTH